MAKEPLPVIINFDITMVIHLQISKVYKYTLFNSAKNKATNYSSSRNIHNNTQTKG